MDARLQNRIQRYGWDRAVDRYEAAWSAQLRPGQDLVLALADLRPRERVLDTACGTGLVSLRAAEIVAPGGHVLGTDISEGMVQAASAAKGAGQGLQFRRMAADALDVENASFDAALCAFGLMYVPDPVAALAELRRALRPGGRAAVVVWGPRARCGWAEIFPIVDARVESEVCPLFFQLGSGDALKMAMEAARFDNIRIQRIGVTLSYASADDALAAAFIAGPVALAYSKFDADTRDAAHAEYLASIEPYAVGAGYELPAEFVAGFGTRAAGTPPTE
ncbi:MAG: methyltransferase domain-containing protein [Caulobacteraceae bacterium]